MFAVAFLSLQFHPQNNEQKGLLSKLLSSKKLLAYLDEFSNLACPVSGSLVKAAICCHRKRPGLLIYSQWSPKYLESA